MDAQDAKLAAEVNRLYWETGKSVRQIREALDITSASLYRHLETFPANRDCEDCDEALGFKNRTTRARGEATCAGCGAETKVEAPATNEAAATGQGEERAGPEEGDWVADAVDDALAGTEKIVREVLLVSVGIVALVAVAVVGFLGHKRRR
ncbi:MAG: hypothetical protein ABFS34_15575 [Gemmatimonadota bacterium]